MGFPPGKNTGLRCHVLLQGIFPTQRLNPHLLHQQADSSLLLPPGKPLNWSKEETYSAVQSHISSAMILPKDSLNLETSPNESPLCTWKYQVAMLSGIDRVECDHSILIWTETHVIYCSFFFSSVPFWVPDAVSRNGNKYDPCLQWRL